MTIFDPHYYCLSFSRDFSMNHQEEEPYQWKPLDTIKTQRGVTFDAGTFYDDEDEQTRETTMAQRGNSNTETQQPRSMYVVNLSCSQE